MHQSILVFRNYMYLKWALLVVAVAIGLYLLHDPAYGVANGGTWLGYGLGTVGALLIVWLMWFGIRKRRYGAANLSVEDWLSAHVYLGLALIFVATLHTGFQFGWNVHTLAYALMMFVIGSGIFGLVAYLRVPDLMTRNRGGATLDQILQDIAELDAQCRDTAMALGDRVNQIVLRAAEDTVIGGSFRQQLSGGDTNCPTIDANRQLQEIAASAATGQSEQLRGLIALMARKEDLVRRARRDVRYKALLDIWLYIHVPISFALLAALATHIVAVFFYW
ncbi:MAG TPA: hypothetical protein DCF61_14035 [Alphaproteobacteria bacterium]|jgi:hypothetical protein|nr:hypothetical protein [Alphaproteobacteria bacterium]